MASYATEEMARRFPRCLCGTGRPKPDRFLVGKTYLLHGGGSDGIDWRKIFSLSMTGGIQFDRTSRM
jgi:hypothetical protein